MEGQEQDLETLDSFCVQKSYLIITRRIAQRKELQFEILLFDVYIVRRRYMYVIEYRDLLN
jgi:hypothetical protein